MRKALKFVLKKSQNSCFFASKKIKFTFINKDNSTTEVEGTIGKSVLDVAHENKIDLEGACESSLACSTCHVYVEPEVYDKLEPPKDEESDLLDLAFGLTEYSRLACQLKISPLYEGTKIKLPKATRNMYVDGKKK